MRTDAVEVAITYAPLGVRDAATLQLAELCSATSLPDFTPRLLEAEAELKKLQHSYDEALWAMKVIAGEAHLPVGYNSLQEVAREWLGRHRPLVSADIPKSDPSA